MSVESGGFSPNDSFGDREKQNIKEFGYALLSARFNDKSPNEDSKEDSFVPLDLPPGLSQEIVYMEYPADSSAIPSERPMHLVYDPMTHMLQKITLMQDEQERSKQTDELGKYGWHAIVGTVNPTIFIREFTKEEKEKAGRQRAIQSNRAAYLKSKLKYRNI